MIKNYQFPRVPEKQTPATPETTVPPSALFRAAWPSLASGSDGSEPPPPSSSSTFRFTSSSSDLVFQGEDLLESLGGSSFQRFPSILSARSGLSSGRRDLLRRWMFGGLRVWGCLPARVSINYPNLWVDYSKPFLKGPCHTRIEWQIRFDPVVCLAGIKDLNLLLDWTLAAVAALVLFWILVKLAVCLYGCFCVVVVCVVVYVVFVVVVVVLLPPPFRAFCRDECHFVCPLRRVFLRPLCRVFYPSM
uniref:Uncharacterized protein n=1 Tax=Fagus sylvatica TaxID=28930 RepID=A0A2N9FVZ6_FAGSY